MPLLGSLLVSLFSGLATFFAQFLTRKVAVATAAVAALGTVTVALLAAFNGLVAPLAAAVFSTQYGQVLGLAFPPMAGTCLAIMASCWAACTLYSWQRKAIELAAQA
jgi:ABC-type uncharacterized transport system permease subunit